MPTVVPTSPVVWLPLIKQQIMTVTGLPSERVILTKRQNPPMAFLQDVYIRPEAISPHDSFVSEAGRINPLVNRQLSVGIRTRLATDAAESDANWLTDPSLGHFQLEDKVLDALLDFLPEDSLGNILLANPIHFSSGTGPTPDDDPTDLGHSILSFSVDYILPLSNQLSTTYP